MRQWSWFHGTVVAILLVAAGLRLWGIDHIINTDENKLVVPSMKMAKGEQEPLLYPKGTHYPHLYHYVLSAVFLPVVFLQPEATYDNYYTNIFLLTARVLSALIGCATVLVTIGIGTRLHSRTTGLIAGLLVASMPLHVKYSHYAHVDIPLTLAVALALYAAIRLWQTGKASWYITTGILVGVSTAILYTGGIAGILIPLAHLPYVIKSYWSWRAIFRPAFLLAIAAIPLTFFVTSPYSFLRYQEVWKTYQAISDRAAAGDLGYTRPDLLWPLWNDSFDWGIPFTSAAIIKEFYPLTFLLAVAGIALALYRRQWALVLLLGATPLLFYLVISGQIRMSAIKRFLPLIPFIAPLAGYAVSALINPRLPRHAQLALVTAVLLLVAVPTIRQAVGFDAAYAAGSTHKIAVDWAYQNIPHGTTVLQHGPLTFFPPDDPNYHVIRLNEVYANHSVTNPEVTKDRARPISSWVQEQGVQIIVLDARLVDRYYEPTSRRLFPETTASYRVFYDDIRQRGKLLYQIEPKYGVIAGPKLELYDVRHLTD